MKMTSQRRIVRLPRAAGFSLIEMLAVIVLIGIVAGIVVQQVGKNVDKGKWGSGKAAVARLAGEVESYSLDNGGPPARLEDLVSKPGNASLACATVMPSACGGRVFTTKIISGTTTRNIGIASAM